MPIKKEKELLLTHFFQFSRRDKLQKLLGTFCLVVLFNKNSSAGHFCDVIISTG